MRASAKDLRFRTKAVLDAVDRGQEVIITYRGKDRAKLIRAGQPKNTVKRTPLFGMWRDDPPSEDVNRYVRNLRKGRF